MKSFLVFSAVRSTSILIWVFITEVRGRLNYGEAELYKPYKPEILQFWQSICWTFNKKTCIPSCVSHAQNTCNQKVCSRRDDSSFSKRTCSAGSSEVSRCNRIPRGRGLSQLLIHRLSGRLREVTRNKSQVLFSFAKNKQLVISFSFIYCSVLGLSTRWGVSSGTNYECQPSLRIWISQHCNRNSVSSTRPKVTRIQECISSNNWWRNPGQHWQCFTFSGQY